eukprot:s7_g47.t1
MTVTFLAAAVGVRQVGGLWVEVGTQSTRRLMYSRKKCKATGIPRSKWQKISFAHDFASPPAFLTSIQTLNNENGMPEKSSEPWFTVAVNRVKDYEAWVSLEMAETSEHGGAQVNQDEVVGYIAIEGGVATLQSSTGAQVTMAAVMSGRTVRGWKTGSYDVALGTDLSAAAPLAVASQCTHYGGDGGWARLRGIISRSHEVLSEFAGAFTANLLGSTESQQQQTKTPPEPV